MTPFTSQEEHELYARVAQARDLHLAGSPYFVDAVVEVVRWFEDRRLARYECAKEERARHVCEFVELLRETDPKRAARAEAA